MGEEYISGVFGLIGTIIGVILTVCINWLSRRGKLYMYVTNQEKEILKADGLGGKTTANNIKEADMSRHKLSIDLYNSSSENKVLREIKIYYIGEKKKKKYSCFMVDDKSRKQLQMLNISPKTSLALNLSSTCSEKNIINEIYNSKRVEIRYRDEKNKINKYKIN